MILGHGRADGDNLAHYCRDLADFENDWAQPEMRALRKARGVKPVD